MARKHSSDDHVDEASLVISATPDRLYDIVTDVSAMGKLSPECTGGRWLDGATGPAVGARFKGTNRRGIARWTTVNTVVEAEQGSRFAFDTKQSGTRWRFRFVADDSGTIATESREPFKRRPLTARVFSRLLLGGVAEHDDEMREGMKATLERLKTVAESESTD